MAGKVRDEVAALAEVIEGLRAEVAALRIVAASHHCHGCGCVHINYTPVPWQPTVNPVPIQITCENPYQTICASTSVAAGGVGTYMVTN